MGGWFSTWFEVHCYVRNADTNSCIRVPYKCLDGQVFPTRKEADAAIKRIVKKEGNSMDDVNIAHCALGVRVAGGFLRVVSV